LPDVDRAFESQADMAAALDLHQHISPRTPAKPVP